MPRLRPKPADVFGRKYQPYGKGISAYALQQHFVGKAKRSLDLWTRELQSSEVRVALAADETWDTAKKAGAGKSGTLATITNEIGECVKASIDRSTKSLCLELHDKRGELLDVKVVFVDNMPTNKQYFMQVFGLPEEHIIQDLRHLMNRIMKTLNNGCARQYAEATKELRTVFTFANEKTNKIMSSIDESIVNGTITGRILKTTESTRFTMGVEGRKTWLAKIKASGDYGDTFASNIPYAMRPISEINKRLEQWATKWKDVVDNRGRRLFSKSTIGAISLQMKDRVKYLTEPIFMYLETGKDSRGLMTYHCFRGTNQTESWHNRVVDFISGTNTGKALANLLLHNGTIRHNANRRREHGRERNLDHYSRRDCEEVDALCEELSMTARYGLVTRVDNGERFFHESIASASSSAAAAASSSSSSAKTKSKKKRRARPPCTPGCKEEHRTSAGRYYHSPFCVHYK